MGWVFLLFFLYLRLPYRINITERKGNIYILLSRLQIYRAGKATKIVQNKM